MVRFFVFTLLLIFCCQISRAQTDVEVFKPVVEIRKPYCEFNLIEMSKLADKLKLTDFLIVVSHLGKSEKSSYAHRRLYNAKTYFAGEYARPFKHSADSIVATEGERVEGNGYMDFYIKGRLELRIYLNKNADFVVTACIVDPPDSRCTDSRERLFFPCKRKD
jgi:hypothetical protein